MYIHVCVYYFFQVKQTILEVEAPLIEQQMNATNDQLQRAVTQINWTTDGMLT